MKDQSFWNVFMSNGDPLAYINYTKNKNDKKQKPSNNNDNKFS